MRPTRLARGLYKTLKWLLLAVLVLIIIIGGVLYYLLGSDSGYRHLPGLINRYTPYTLDYDELDGSLLGGQRWQNLHLHGGGLDIRVAELCMNLNAGDLLSGALNLSDIQLHDAEITLPSSGNGGTVSEMGGGLEKLPRVALPLDISLKNFSLYNITLRQGGEQLLHMAHGNLNADYRDSRLKLQGSLDTDKGSLKLDGNAETQGDYPLNLSIEADSPLLAPKQNLRLHIRQSLLRPQTELTLQGVISGALQLSADIDLNARVLQSRLDWQNLDYAQQYRSKSGGLRLNGSFDNLQGELQTVFSGKELPPLEISANTTIAGAELRGIDLGLNTLGGRVRFQGNANLSGKPSWQGKLDIRGINGKSYRPDLDLQLDGSIQTHGSDDRAYLVINSLKGQWQKQALDGQGSLEYGNGSLVLHELQLQLAGNRLRANGSADNKRADINLDLAVPGLDRLLPLIGGDINGRVHIGGSLQQPQLDGNLNWKNLRIGDKQNPTVTSRQGSATAKGSLDRLAVTLNGDARGADFPPLTNIKGSGILNPTENIRDIKLEAQSLQGKLQLGGESGWAPHVTWNAKLRADKLRPNQWEKLKTLDGEISTELSSSGSIKDGKTVLTADMASFSGHWQKQPLNGKGKITLNGEKLGLKALDIRAGDNRVALDGNINGEQLALEFSLDAKQLNSFYPALVGSLSGRGKIGGSLQTPDIQVQLSGKNLAYDGHKIAALQAELASSLKKNGRFNNRIQLQGVQSGGQQWKEIQLASDGRYERHSLKLRSSGGDANLQLAAAGGFSAINTWKGELEPGQLEVDGYDMQWRLKQRSTLEIAPQKLLLRNFCLADQHSSFCLNLKRDKQTELNYQVSRLDPKSFSKLVPKNIRLQTGLQGEGKITVAAGGQLRGSTNLHLTPGSINISIKGQPPLNLQLKTARLQSRFSGKQVESTLAVDLGDSGIISGHALIGDYQKQNLSGEIKINLPDIGKFRNFVPKASEMRGRVNGVLQFTGTAKAPVVSGDIQLENGLVKIPEYATELKNIRLKLSAHRSGQIDVNGNIGTPEGNLDVNGVLRLAPTRLNLQLAGKNMLIADSKTMMAAISPDFRITIDPDSGIDIQGKVHVPKASVSVPDTSGGVEVSRDVVVLNEGNKDLKKSLQAEPLVPLKADIEITLGDKVYFKNRDVNIRLKGGIILTERAGRPLAAKGIIQVVSGVYGLYGQELEIRRGKVTFTGGSIANPSIDVLALRDIENKDIKVGASVTGSVDRLQLKLTSTPAMPDSAILSYLLFGRSPDGTMDNEALLQTAAGLSLGGILPGGNLGKKTGLDVFDLGVGGLKAGKYLGKDMYVGLKSNFFTGITQFLARYQFTEHFNVEISSEAENRAIDFLYEFEKD